MFEALSSFAQQHTFKASSWAEEAKKTLAQTSGYSSQAITVLGIHALNHGNFEFFKHCMENGGHIQGLTASEMESYFKAFNVYRQTALDRIDPLYNEDLEYIEEFIPYYRPYCFRSNPTHLHSFILMGGRVLSPLFRIAFTSKGLRYQQEKASILHLNPYCVNKIPVSVWRKVFDEECFFKNGKPKASTLVQFHRLIFSHLFIRYQGKPNFFSDEKRHVPNVSDTLHFVDRYLIPTGSVIHLFKTPPLKHYPWYSPEEAEHVFELSIDQAHIKSLLQIFNENHQWHHQHVHTTRAPIEFCESSFSLNQHHEKILLAAASHTFGLPFDFSTVNSIDMDDLVTLDNFIAYEEGNGVFSNTGKHLLEVCLFNLIIDHPKLFNACAHTREAKANNYLFSFLDNIPLFYPLMFPGISLEHKHHHVCHHANLTIVASIFEKLSEELKNDFKLHQYADFEDEIKGLCALFDGHSNPHELLQEQIKQLQSRRFPPLFSLLEEPDDDGAWFAHPRSLITDYSRHGVNLQYVCLQYALVRSQLLTVVKSAEKSRIQTVFQHLHRLYPEHKITQSIHCMVLQKHVRSVNASSQNHSETSRF